MAPGALPRDRSFCVMTDQYQSHFDGIAARAAASRRDRFVVGLLLGLILGGGLTLLWTINRSAPRATKDLQTTEQKIVRPASVPPTNTRIESGGDKASPRIGAG